MIDREARTQIHVVRLSMAQPPCQSRFSDQHVFATRLTQRIPHVANFGGKGCQMAPIKTAPGTPHRRRGCTPTRFSHPRLFRGSLPVGARQNWPSMGLGADSNHRQTANHRRPRILPAGSAVASNTPTTPSTDAAGQPAVRRRSDTALPRLPPTDRFRHQVRVPVRPSGRGLSRPPNLQCEPDGPQRSQAATTRVGTAAPTGHTPGGASQSRGTRDGGPVLCSSGRHRVGRFRTWGHFTAHSPSGPTTSYPRDARALR